jgi:hypothetical protein
MPKIVSRTQAILLISSTYLTMSQEIAIINITSRQRSFTTGNLVVLNSGESLMMCVLRFVTWLFKGIAWSKLRLFNESFQFLRKCKIPLLLLYTGSYNVTYFNIL